MNVDIEFGLLSGAQSTLLILFGVLLIIGVGLSFRFWRDHHKYNQWKRDHEHPDHHEEH